MRRPRLGENLTTRWCQQKVLSIYMIIIIINPRRACAARVIVLGLCVCVCVRSNLPPHTLESQKRDTNGFIAMQEPFFILLLRAKVSSTQGGFVCTTLFSSPHMVLRSVQNFQLFSNLTFELQSAGYVCALCTDAILHLVPPTGPKGRTYDIPYSAYISRVFNFANFANLESFAKLFQRNNKKTAIRENLDPRNISAIWYIYILYRHGCIDFTRRAHFACNYYYHYY